MPTTTSHARRPGALAFAVLATILAALLPQAPARADATVVTEYEGGNEPYVYTPETVNIAVGDSVTWTNPSGNPLEPAADHPTYCGTPGTKGDCPWSSFPLSPGESFTVEFPTEGSFGYACAIHPYMTGWVIVGDGEPDPAPEPDPEPEPEPTAAEPSEEPDASDEPTTDDGSDDPDDEPSEDATEDASDEPSEEPSEDASPSGPRDALSGIGGTVFSDNSTDDDDASGGGGAAAPGSDAVDTRTPEELAGQDTPTGFRSLVTLSVLGLAAGGGMLFRRTRQGGA